MYKLCASFFSQKQKIIYKKIHRLCLFLWWRLRFFPEQFVQIINYSSFNTWFCHMYVYVLHSFYKFIYPNLPNFFFLFTIPLIYLNCATISPISINLHLTDFFSYEKNCFTTFSPYKFVSFFFPNQQKNYFIYFLPLFFNKKIPAFS